MTVAGETTASGYARVVDFDAGGLVASDTGADGVAVDYTWDDATQDMLTEVDHHAAASAGLESAWAYDAEGRLTDQWGPAPPSCFGAYTDPYGDATADPNGTCTPTPPHTATAYDQGLTAWPRPGTTTAARPREPSLSTGSCPGALSTSPPAPRPGSNRRGAVLGHHHRLGPAQYGERATDHRDQRQRDQLQRERPGRHRHRHRREHQRLPGLPRLHRDPRHRPSPALAHLVELGVPTQPRHLFRDRPGAGPERLRCPPAVIDAGRLPARLQPGHQHPDRQRRHRAWPTP